MTEERRSAEKFARTLEEIFTDSLESVLLYGSAARDDEYRPGVSDLNVLVVLRELGMAELIRAAVPTREWVRNGNPPPLLLGADEWRSSADVFALEYSDIVDAHLVLAGATPVDSLRILRSDLRVQLEREIRSKKIQLREGFLVAGEEETEVGSLLVRALPTFLTLFRGCLRLNGLEVPRDGEALLSEAASLMGFDPDPLLAVRRARSEGDSLSSPLGGPLATGYLRAVESAAAWLDDFRGDDLPEHL